MPEYSALIHFHRQDDDQPGPPPSTDEMAAAFMRMDRAGIAKVH